jgi:hypothetical protein
MKDFFKYNDAIEFFDKVDLYNIEPFTMIIFDRNRLFELVWDGMVKNVNELDKNKMHVWSSSTLYTPELQQLRRKWFHDWFEAMPELSLENIMALHRNGGKEDPKNGYIMNRDNRVCTVSITHIIKDKNKIEMIYEDRIKDSIQKSSVNINQLLA